MISDLIIVTLNLFKVEKESIYLLAIFTHRLRRFYFNLLAFVFASNFVVFVEGYLGFENTFF
jgi:hypothetical protein